MLKLTVCKLCCFVVLLFIWSACRKETLQGTLEQGKIALTFDDATIENWNNYLPLLDSLHIKATFYISHYHTLNAQKKAWLKNIERNGHEIAFHTSTHTDLAKAVAKDGMAKTEAAEIKKDLDMMTADGYSITNFAYPFGSHSSQLNTCLLRTFKSVRALSNKQNYNKSLVKEAGDKKVLYGANVDNNTKIFETGVLQSLLDKTQEHNDCLVLVAHQINNPAVKLQISRERLQTLALAAAQRNLKFITVNQIAF